MIDEGNIVKDYEVYHLKNPKSSGSLEVIVKQVSNANIVLDLVGVLSQYSQHQRVEISVIKLFKQQ